MTMIYGECIYGGTRSPVTISQLRAEECMLALGNFAELDGDLELWIGAVGPFHVTPGRGGEQGFPARFKTPLEPAILNHFNA